MSTNPEEPRGELSPLRYAFSHARLDADMEAYQLAFFGGAALVYPSEEALNVMHETLVANYDADEHARMIADALADEANYHGRFA